MSKNRDTVDIEAFKQILDLNSASAYALLKRFPLQAYTGSPRALGKIRINEGSMLYQLEYGELDISEHVRWPRMYAAKCSCRLF